MFVQYKQLNNQILNCFPNRCTSNQKSNFYAYIKFFSLVLGRVSFTWLPKVCGIFIKTTLTNLKTNSLTYWFLAINRFLLLGLVGPQFKNAKIKCKLFKISLIVWENSKKTFNVI